MNEGKKILVTGGAGYIGSHVIIELIENGFNPVIVDDFRNASKEILNGIEKITCKRIKVHEIDICDLSKLEVVFESHEFDGIMHFAAYKSVNESVEDPLSYYENNLMGLINILKMATKFEVEKFVFSSSCTVYGTPKGSFTVDEETPFDNAYSPYGATKQMGERILEDVVASGANVNVLNLRYFNPIGAHKSGLIGELPTGHPNNLVPFVMQTASGKRDSLTVFGNDYQTHDGTCIRDYIHVCDVAEAHVKGLDWLYNNDEVSLEVVNIGTGKGTSVLELIHIFEEVTGVSIDWKFGERRAGDVSEIYANVDKASELINWRASRSVEEAVIDAWKWEQRN